MPQLPFKTSLIASALLACAGAALSAVPAAASAPAATQAAVPAHSAASVVTKKAKAAKPAKPPKAAKLIDINSASRTELKTLATLSDEQIDKLIATRPFLTKADLVTSNVVPAGIYMQIKRKIVAKQTLPLKLKPQ